MRILYLIFFTLNEDNALCERLSGFVEYVFFTGLEGEITEIFIENSIRTLCTLFTVNYFLNFLNKVKVKRNW